MKKVVLITGSDSSLGKAVVNILLSKGFVVCAGVHGNSKSFASSKNLVEFTLDVTNDKQIYNVVTQIIKKFKRIDVLVNIAGLTKVGPTLDFEVKDFNKLLDVNVVGPFRLIKQIYPYMSKQEGGRVINVTSLNGLVSLPNFGLYSASKSALESLGLALNYELTGKNIKVTNVAAGAIKKESKLDAGMPHRSAREKFIFLKAIMPIIKPKYVAQNICDVIEDEVPPSRVVLGNDAKITYFLYRFLPESVWNKLMMFVWNKK